jgi:uncharacterized membrane protein (DUF2068 family)
MWEDAEERPAPISAMTASSVQLRASAFRTHHDRWIIAIGLFKLFQALLFILLGFGAMRLLHKDLMDIAEHFVLAMRFDPEGHFVNLFLDKVALIDPHRLKQISAVVFAIAGLDIIEGTGLVLERVWAEYVTLVLTASFLPWEFFEILRHVTWIRVVLLVINLAVVAYLLYYVKLRVHQRREGRHKSLG